MNNRPGLTSQCISNTNVVMSDSHVYSLKVHSPVAPFAVETESADTFTGSTDEKWIMRLAPTSLPVPASTILYSHRIQNLRVSRQLRMPGVSSAA